MKLKSIANIRTGLSTARKKASVTDKCFNYQAINMKVFDEDTTIISEKLDKFQSKEKVSVQYLTQEGDVLIRLREPNHSLYIDRNHTQLLIPSIIGIIRLNNNDVNSQFLAYYLNSSAIKKQLIKHKQGNTIITTNMKDIENLEINLPSQSKQEKIVKMMKTASQELKLIKQLKTTKQHFYNKLFNQLVEKRVESGAGAEK